jgi:parallel beta-helix repeat protein
MCKGLVLLGLVVTCPGLLPADESSVASVEPQVYRLSPGADFPHRLQSVLIQAVPGDVIELAAGHYPLVRQIDIATSHLTIRGAGSDRTVLDFQGQQSGGQGLEATGDHFVIEGLAIQDTAGNAIKVLGARQVTFRDVRVEWTGPAQETNGAYGLYPVQCQDVLIEKCAAYGASDAGIYVGQCRRVIVRQCRAERNVAGIEIENTVGADVYDNVATNNTGGILVFDLPGLPLRAGRQVRVYQNRVHANNHPNFAKAGNMVATVPSGAGIMVMATDEVEIFDNEITDNQTANVALVSYMITSKKSKDAQYDPISESITVRDNRFSGGGTRPSGEFGNLVAKIVGSPLPDIVCDGIINPQKLVEGKLPPALRLSITGNGDATFANFHLDQITPANLALGKVSVDRDLAEYATSRPGLDAVTLDPPQPPPTDAPPVAMVYRAAPPLLSDWDLFEGNGRTQQPASGVVPYTLNTTLFSDYTSKYRFIRIPPGSSIRYASDGPLEFPEGTVIAKTFSYPVDMNDPNQGEELLETRIEFLQQGEWYGYSYRWNDAQTEAKLVLGGSERETSWVHTDGQPRTNHYEIPNANQCLGCHSVGKKYVPIGPTAANLDREFPYPGGPQNQLEYLAQIEWLEGLPTAQDRTPLPVAEDPSTGSLDARARAWLHVNCAHCHSPQGTARTSGLDLRLAQTDPAKLGFWKIPVAAGQGSGGHEYDIVPGHPEKSILLYRIESEDPSIRMPNVARSLVPTEAAELIRAWIAALPAER